MKASLKLKILKCSFIACAVAAGANYSVTEKLIKAAGSDGALTDAISSGYGQDLEDFSSRIDYPLTIKPHQQGLLTRTQGLDKIILNIPKEAVSRSTVFNIKFLSSTPDFFEITSSGEQKLRSNFNVSVYFPLPLSTSSLKAYYINSEGKYTELQNAIFDPAVSKASFKNDRPGKYYIGYTPLPQLSPQTESNMIFIDGSLVRDIRTRKIYLIKSNTIIPIRNLGQLKAYQGKRILNISSKDLAGYEQ